MIQKLIATSLYDSLKGFEAKIIPEWFVGGIDNIVSIIPEWFVDGIDNIVLQISVWLVDGIDNIGVLRIDRINDISQ